MPASKLPGRPSARLAGTDDSARTGPASAQEHGCASVAYTYNDPVLWAEYAIDTAVAGVFLDKAGKWGTRRLPVGIGR